VAADSPSVSQGAGGTDPGGGSGTPTTMGQGFGRVLGIWTLESFLVFAGFVASVLSILALASTNISLLGPALLLLVPGGIFTGVLLWKPFPWTYLAAGFANSLVGFLAIPFGLVGVLLNPLLGARYSGYVLAALALLLAFPAGVSGFRQLRGRVPPRPLREGIRTLHGFVAIALVALSVGALMAGFFAIGSIPTGEAIDFEPGDEISLQTVGGRFEPPTFDVTIGVVTRITVLNEDPSPHTFTYTVNGTTYSHGVPGRGGVARFLVLFTQTGTIPFWSTTPGDEDMTGTITVVQK
jgi:hypothetical protein